MSKQFLKIRYISSNI